MSFRIFLFVLVSWAASFGSVFATERGEAVERIGELRREIARHDELYFREAAPEISDFDYDRLKAELLRLEELYPEAAEIGRVGDDRVEGFARYRHGAPMLSLEKAHSEEDLAGFHRRVAEALGREEVDYWVEPKYDGVAVSLVYERGRLARAATRGNGIEGDDITENARTIGALREVLRVDGGVEIPERMEIRGEIFMSFAEFGRINGERLAAGEAAFANPRNLAAGTVKLRDSREVAERRLELVCFGWGEWEPEETRARDLAEFGEMLGEWGLPAAEGRKAAGFAELREAVAEIERKRDELSFPIDGAVVKVARVAEQDLLGVGTAGPRWAVAVKFAPRRARTRLVGISLQVGRTGMVTPVAELEPVLLAGTTVSRATLHNAAQIERLDLRVGDAVWVEKAGEIIPAVVGVDLEKRKEGAERFAFPETCPECGDNLERREERAAIFCGNGMCPARIGRRVEHFASALGIRGLGAATVAVLVERGLESPADLYDLGMEDLVGIEGIGERSAKRLLAEIAASRSVDWDRVIFGLGIPGIGKTRAAEVARVLRDWAALRNAGVEDFAKAGLGEKSAAEAVAFLRSEAVVEMLAGLERAGLVGGETGGSKAAVSGRFAGEVVVLTGRLERWTRKEAAARLEAEGAGIRDSVTRETTLLVAGEKAGAKLERARELGIAVIDEAELARRLEEERE